MAECPQRTVLNALQASLCPQRQEKEENVEEEEEEPAQMGALRFFRAMKKQVVAMKRGTEKGLMFVEATINGKTAKSVMVDTGATHNFISEAKAKRLGLKLEKDSGRM